MATTDNNNDLVVIDNANNDKPSRLRATHIKPWLNAIVSYVDMTLVIPELYIENSPPISAVSQA